jgi:hypothetical protein
MKNRGKLDDTLAAMFSNPDYFEDYLFYAHMIGMCSIKINKKLDSCAGVQFDIDHYNLYINPFSKWVEAKDVKDNIKIQMSNVDFKIEDGKKMVRIMKGFDDYIVTERLAILKHEMLHILYNHVSPEKYTRIIDSNKYSLKSEIKEILLTKDDDYIKNLYKMKFKNILELYEYINKK